MSQSTPEFRLMGREAHVRRERWERIKDIFDQALARDEAERDALLVEASGDDGELLAELRSLLAAFAESFLKPSPALENGASERSEAPAELVGARVGSYRITEKIGRGGMGESTKPFTSERARSSPVSVWASTHSSTTRRHAVSCVRCEPPRSFDIRTSCESMGLPIGRASRSC